MWRVLLGLAWLVPSLWVWVTRAGVVVAGHPAYPLLVGLATVVGAAGWGWAGGHWLPSSAWQQWGASSTYDRSERPTTPFGP